MVIILIMMMMLMMMLMMVDDDVNNYDVDDYHYNDFLRQEPHLGCFQITRLAWHSLLGFHLKVQIDHHQKSSSSDIITTMTVKMVTII